MHIDFMFIVVFVGFWGGWGCVCIRTIWVCVLLVLGCGVVWFGVFVLVSFIVCGLQAHKALSGTPALNGPFEMDGKFTKSHTVVARASVRLLLCVWPFEFVVKFSGHTQTVCASFFLFENIIFSTFYIAHSSFHIYKRQRRPPKTGCSVHVRLTVWSFAKANGNVLLHINASCTNVFSDKYMFNAC